MLRTGFFLFAVALWLSAGAAEKTLQLTGGGRSDYVIVLPDSPRPAEATAAAELQKYLREISGVRLPVVAASAAPAANRIWIGDSPAVRRALADVDLDRLKADEIIIRTVGSDLILTGNPPRGTLYAVYTLLEDRLGCRWWTATESTIPANLAITVGELDIRYAPVFFYRDLNFNRALKTDAFAARLKDNGHYAKISEEFGGYYNFAGFVHTFRTLLPPAKYFADHPEWYALVDGKRTTAQMCLSNDDMVAEMAKNAIERIRTTNPRPGFISISQNDWGGNCRCDRCRAADQSFGSPSGLLLQAVNRVAAEIEKVYPDVWVETLAYTYSRQPPKDIRPRHNVIIRLCSIEINFLHPMTDPGNRKFMDDLLAWQAIAPRLFIWDYVTNFTQFFYPHPNLYTLGPNIRTFAANRAVGVYEQGDNGSATGDFIRLRTWLLLHLLWNPQADDQALIDEFLTGYYGPAAAPHLRSYLDLIHQSALKADLNLTCYMKNCAWLGDEEVLTAYELFDRALAAAQGEIEHGENLGSTTLSVAPDVRVERVNRIRRERLSLDAVVLERYVQLEKYAREAKRPFPIRESAPELAWEFMRLSRLAGNRYYDELSEFEVYEDRLRRQYDLLPAGEIPELCRNLTWRDRTVISGGSGLGITFLSKWAAVETDPGSGRQIADFKGGSDRRQFLQYCYNLEEGETYRLFAEIRCDGSADSGDAFRFTVGKSKTKETLLDKTVPVAAVKGARYRVVDLGTFTGSYRCYIAGFGIKRPAAEVSDIRIDRIFYVKESALAKKP